MCRRLPCIATDDRAAQFAAAEAALTKALSLAPEHAFAHACLGLRPNPDQPRAPRHSRMRTGVGAGSKSGRTLMQCIGLAKFLIGRGEETEAHVQEALRLSPRDTFAYLGW